MFKALKYGGVFIAFFGFAASAGIADNQSDYGVVSPLPGLMEEVTSMAGRRNDERLTALQAVLRKYDIPYKVEKYTYDVDEIFGAAEEGREIPEDMLELKNSLTGIGANLVVTLGGHSPSADVKEIVVGAHYDQVPIGQGVVDNAASSIILTRIAKRLKNEKLAYRLRIVWFGDEELGLIGSQQYVAAHKADNIVSMINLDVNGYGDTMMMGSYRDSGINRLYQIAAEVNVRKGFQFMMLPQTGGSDNEAFDGAGIEAIGISMAPAEEAHEFWLALNAEDEALQPKKEPKVIGNMHSELDHISLIDPAAMTQSFEVVIGMLKELNKNP